MRTALSKIMIPNTCIRIPIWNKANTLVGVLYVYASDFPHHQ